LIELFSFAGGVMVGLVAGLIVGVVVLVIASASLIDKEG
jgi:thiamine transporter ThiT